MKLSRWRLAAASAATTAAVVVVIGSLAGARPTAPVALTAATQQAAAGPPVIVNCLGRGQVRPPVFVLSCADANGELAGMQWWTWRASAYGTGMSRVNDCVPSCAQGRFYDLPTLVVLWRPEPLPHHLGVLYFTRLTGIFTGRHCLPGPGGRPVCLPVTSTRDLGATSPDQ